MIMNSPQGRGRPYKVNLLLIIVMSVCLSV